MPKFNITFIARLKNAIGTYEQYSEVVEGMDKTDARLKLYDKYEHISILTNYQMVETVA